MLKSRAEDVVEHERCPLRRGELFEDDHQRHAHRVVEGDPICEIDVGARRTDDRLGEPRADIGPLDPLMGPQAIDAQPGGDGDQPTTHVVERLDVDGEESAVRLLHHILRVVDAAEHAVSDIEHPPTVLMPRFVDLRSRGFRMVVHVIQDVRVRRSVTPIAMSHRRRSVRPSCRTSTDWRFSREHDIHRHTSRPRRPARLADRRRLALPDPHARRSAATRSHTPMSARARSCCSCTRACGASSGETSWPTSHATFAA